MNSLNTGFRTGGIKEFQLAAISETENMWIFATLQKSISEINSECDFSGSETFLGMMVLLKYALHLWLCQLLCSMLWCTCTRHLSPCRYVLPLPDIPAGIKGFPPRSVIETVWIVEENREEYLIDVAKHVRSDYFTCLEDDSLDQSLCLGALERYVV